MIILLDAIEIILEQKPSRFFFFTKYADIHTRKQKNFDNFVGLKTCDINLQLNLYYYNNFFKTKITMKNTSKASKCPKFIKTLYSMLKVTLSFILGFRIMP
jgi:hypothetical protein